jgi:hypothetical protein
MNALQDVSTIQHALSNLTSRWEAQGKQLPPNFMKIQRLRPARSAGAAGGAAGGSSGGGAAGGQAP